MNRTGIEYLDYVCNPITGCSGEGCAVRKRCWALAMSKRLRGRYGYPKENPFEPTFHKDKLIQPLQVKKPSLIGLCFMGDFFDKKVKPSWQTQVYDMVWEAYWHTFLTLTKQPQNISHGVNFYSNFWIGVSVNRVADLWRIDALREIDVDVKVVSIEPLYEDLGEINLKDIDWVIIGAQTRPYLRPKFSWLAHIFDQTSELQIPLFTKNNLGSSRVVQQYPRGVTK